MQRWIPIRAAVFVARIFDEAVLRLHGVACGFIRQIGNPQMHRRDAGKGKIIGIERRCHRG